MGKAIYIHEVKNEQVLNETKDSYEEYVRDGPKGLSFKFMRLSKGGKKDSFKKISGKEVEKDKFNIIVRSGEDTKELTLDTKGLADMLKKDKDLGFVSDYISKTMKKFRESMDKQSAGAKRRSSKRKSSKRKSSKRKSSKRKQSRRRKSKKGSKKSSKRKSSKKKQSRRRKSKSSKKKSSKKRKSKKVYA